MHTDIVTFTVTPQAFGSMLSDFIGDYQDSGGVELDYGDLLLNGEGDFYLDDWSQDPDYLDYVALSDEILSYDGYEDLLDVDYDHDLYALA